ncbi:MAG: capsule polysaccharide export protein KpsE/RkpR [Vicingaceae bacterium]|jgi:capsule polysaccharide export protein KpsE/RkpR
MENLETKTTMKSNIEIVKFAAKKWKLLLAVGLIAGIFAFVFTLPQFIPPKFKSKAVIYPANLGQYAEENGLEQMQQYLESNELRNHIVAKYNLYDEYDIDQDDPNKKSWMKSAYAEHITFDKTRFESIKIEVLSTEPVKARDIAQEIIEELNQIIRRTERKKYQEIVVITKRMVEDKKADLDSLEKKITELSTRYGILDYEVQSERVTEKYMDFLLSGKKGKDFDEAKTLFENLQKYGRKSYDYHFQQTAINSHYMNRLREYELALKNLNKIQTYSNVVVAPEVPDRKSSPVRWFILIAAIGASVVFTFALLLVSGYQNK